MSTIKMSEIEPGMRDFTIEAEVLSKQSIAVLSKPLAKAVITDGTKEMILNLWRDQVTQVNVGDRILVRKCFVRKSHGRPELNTWEPIEVIKARKSGAKVSEDKKDQKKKKS